MLVDGALLRRWIEDWEPPDKPHCSNCRHATVSGDAASPLVQCAMGYDGAISLARMIRPSHPRQFSPPAQRCPDFASMSEEP